MVSWRKMATCSRRSIIPMPAIRMRLFDICLAILVWLCFLFGDGVVENGNDNLCLYDDPISEHCHFAFLHTLLPAAFICGTTKICSVLKTLSFMCPSLLFYLFLPFL